MKRVLVSLLFLATAIQAATPAPQNSAASQPERLVSVAQSPYDFRFHIEHSEWDQVDATLRRMPTNYQFDAYKGNTPLMMVIDLFAHKVTDKPKSIWQTAVGGAAKACGGAALVVVGLAFALRAKNNWNAAQPVQPKGPRVRFGGAEHVDVDDALDNDNEADEKEAAAQPRVRLQRPPHQDETLEINQKRGAARMNDRDRAEAEQKKLNAEQQRIAEKRYFSPIDYSKNFNGIEQQVHDFHYHTAKPALDSVADDVAKGRNEIGKAAYQLHETLEDARDAMAEGRQAVRDANKNLKAVGKDARKTMKQIAHEAKQMKQSINQRAEEVSNNVQEGVEILRDQGNRAWSFGAAFGQGVGAVGCLLTGLWSGWKGFKNIRSLIGLPQRTQDLHKLRLLITDLLHRKDVNLGIQNSDGETALQMVRRYMAENMNDRESYQLLSEVEQLIMIRQA